MSHSDGPTLYLTSVSTHYPQMDRIYAPDPGRGGQFVMVGSAYGGMGRAELTMEMDLTPGSDAILRAIMANNRQIRFGVPRQEYRCVFCGVPNDLERKICTQCGGPRGWIM